MQGNKALPQQQTRVSAKCLECSTQNGKCLSHARRKRLTGINDSLGLQYHFESRLHFEIKLEVTITRGMAAPVRIGFQSTPNGFLGADAFQNSPRLMQGIRHHENILDLIPARERTPIEEDYLRWIARQEISGSFEHQLQAEVVLAR